MNGTNRHQEYPWIGDAMPHWMHLRDTLDMRNNLAHNFTRTAHYPQDPYVYHLSDELGLITVAEVPNIKSLAFGKDIQFNNVLEMVRRLRNHPSIFMWSVGNETDSAADSAWVAAEDPTRYIHQRKTENFGLHIDHDHTNLDMESLLRVTVRDGTPERLRICSQRTQNSCQKAGRKPEQKSGNTFRHVFRMRAFVVS
ncbi:MAG: hypothetical protein LR015_07820 [Verrucomicrobia bacterium]|nr:hypothetical protein [Verrucomicrobiota bacterium]